MAPWRDRVQALKPAYYRLFVDWAKLQPVAGVPPDFDIPGDGCMRGSPPCAPFSGLRDVLRAVRSQQRATGGFRVVTVIYGVPDWAAHAPGGCERTETAPRSRPVSATGLEGYRAFVRALLALGRQTGVAMRWWSPWNEPNHPAFISPQRDRCDKAAPPRSPAVYAQLARALHDELDAAPGRHDLVLGELAGFHRSTAKSLGITEFVRALPDDVACSGAVWAQHQYVDPAADQADPGAVGELEAALRERPCTRDAHVWVTETGAGGTHAGQPRDSSRAGLAPDCRAQATALARWAADPRVDAAFQYTFREDPAFPVGLADAILTRTYPAYELWRAWGPGRAPDAGRVCG